MLRQIKKGHQQLTYSYLLRELIEISNEFIANKFAGGLLNNAIDTGLIDPTFDTVICFETGVFSNMTEGQKSVPRQVLNLGLQRHIIDVILKQTRGFVQEDVPDLSVKLNDAKVSLHMRLSHSMRARFINATYEIIEKYIERYQKEVSKDRQKSHLRETLKKQDFYLMLHILRNIASHADGLHTEFKYDSSVVKHLRGKVFKWNNIFVKEGMMTHEVRYNDFELLQLSEELFDYISNNKKLFTVAADGEEIKYFL